MLKIKTLIIQVGVELKYFDPIKKTASLGNQEKALSVSCLEYEPTIPAKFMLGTDQGVALGCSRKAKCQAEYILNTYQAHYGPVRALQRNPCYTKVISNSVMYHLIF